MLDSFVKHTLSGWDVYLNPGAFCDTPDAKTAGEVIDNIRGPFEKVPASKSADVFRAGIGLYRQPEVLYIKFFKHRNLRDALKALFRPSRAARAAYGAILLEKAELHAPQTVAVLEKRFGPIIFENVLVTKEVKDAHSVNEYFGKIWKRSPNKNSRDRHEMAKQLAEYIAKMHNAGIVHGDLRAGNILARKTETAWQFSLLDNERTKKVGTVNRELTIKNLVQVNMHFEYHRTDRIRFLNAYSAKRKGIEISSKKLAKLVTKITTQRLKTIKQKITRSVQ